MKLKIFFGLVMFAALLGIANAGSLLLLGTGTPPTSVVSGCTGAIDLSPTGCVNPMLGGVSGGAAVPPPTCDGSIDLSSGCIQPMLGAI